MSVKNLFLFLLLSILLCAGTSPAQTSGKISGTAKDAATGEPVIGCNVTVAGTRLGASTDVDGSYFILNVPPGKYDILASVLGYDKVLQQDVVVNAGRTTTLNFALKQTVLEQKEVVIEATRPDVEREKTSTSAIVRAEDVKAVAGMRTVSDVLSLAADVTDGHFRGGRENEEYYTLQGMGIVNPLDNSSAFLPIMSAVEEVEVITSGFGAQYGNAQSGVVNISMKEGQSDRWRSTLETRSRAPGRKHFGPSVYDPNANAYLSLLMDPGTWRFTDPSLEGPQADPGAMGSGLKSRYGGDSLVQLAVARALWLQSRRDINRNYGNQLDYSVEASTGGPVSEGIRMFLALRSNNEWPIFPTPEPDIERQAMGNIAIDLTKTMSLRLSTGFTKENTNVFPGTNGTGGYQRWLWDRITGLNYRDRTNVQLGARFTHTLSPSTFYELKLNSLTTTNLMGATPVPDGLADSVGSVPWGTLILPLVNNGSPDAINYQAGYDVFRDEETRTLSFEGGLTSQVTPAHMLNAGIQMNSYRIDVSNVLSLRNNNNVERYRSNPFEAAVYLQDKMEFEGMIANAGLRLDTWSSGTEYFTSPYTPFLVPDSNHMFHPELAPKQSAPTLGRLQPRAGISFPVTVNTVFHVNYGSFMQRPSFQYVVSTRVSHATSAPVLLGNPRLEPEVTNQYDIGITQGLGEGFTLDVSGYYKDVKNLIEQANFTDGRTGQQVSSYFNRDYADIRGFRIALTRRHGTISGSLNYQFGVATGKSATVTAAIPEFRQDTTGIVTTDLSNVPVRDILLDFDRTHNLVVNLAATSGDSWGPEFLGSRPLANVTVSTNSFFRSGRPYTSPSHKKLINEERAPGETNTNLRITKRIPDFFGTAANIYLEVFNLFDNTILNYDYVFAKPTPSNPNYPLEYYEQLKNSGRDPINDPELGIRYWYNTGTQGPYSIDQSFLIYDNEPRSVSFGIALEL